MFLTKKRYSERTINDKTKKETKAIDLEVDHDKIICVKRKKTIKW